MKSHDVLSLDIVTFENTVTCFFIKPTYSVQYNPIM